MQSAVTMVLVGERQLTAWDVLRDPRDWRGSQPNRKPVLWLKVVPTADEMPGDRRWPTNANQVSHHCSDDTSTKRSGRH